MNGETTFLDEFNATAPDLSREVNVIVYGGSPPGPTPPNYRFGGYQASFSSDIIIPQRNDFTVYEEEE